MSRTDKTDPMWVKMMDPANRLEVQEVHNHVHGVCDIDAFHPRDDGFWRRRDGYCYRAPKPFKKMYCNCSWCHRDPWSNYYGAERAEWKQQQRAWLKGFGEDRRERDIPTYK